MTELSQWNNFYVILGSSAGALIGLQFVVVALIADLPNARADAQAGAMSAAPWYGLRSIAVFWGLVGAVGIIYSGIVARRLRRQNAYEPVLEDWVFHLALPIVAYAVLLASSVLVQSYTHIALFMPGSAAWFCYSSESITLGTRRPITSSSPIAVSERTKATTDRPSAKRKAGAGGSGSVFRIAFSSYSFFASESYAA